MPGPDPAGGPAVGTVSEESRLLVEAIVAGLDPGPRDGTPVEESSADPTSEERRDDPSVGAAGGDGGPGPSRWRSPLQALLSRVDPTVLRSAADAAELLSDGLRAVADGLGPADHPRPPHGTAPHTGSRHPRKDTPPCP